jgi:hypothetical protein
MSPTGRFDPLTELYLKFKKDSSLSELKEDTVKACEGTLVILPGGKKLSGENSEEEVVEEVSQEPAGDKEKAVSEDGEVMPDPADEEEA